jgi:hypothetical protein
MFRLHCRYKSFSRDRDNIGDITAKGEAQIAVIDLLGLLLGVRISRLTELSRSKVVGVFLLLSAVDLYCVYNEIQRYAALYSIWAVAKWLSSNGTLDFISSRRHTASYLMR